MNEPLLPNTTEHDQRISEDLACVSCQYNLRTLSVRGLCPECGTPVARSVEEVRVFGKGGRRPVFWRSLIVNTVALYLPALVFLLIWPDADYNDLFIWLAAACPVVLPAVMLADNGASDESWKKVFFAAAVFSATLPWLTAYLSARIIPRYGFAVMIPACLFGVVLFQTVVSVLIIAAAG